MKEVISWLEQIKKLDELIEAKKAEEELLRGIATKSGFDGMPHNSGVSDVVGNNAIRLLDIEQEAKLLQQQRDDIIKTMQELPATQFGVLHRQYVRYMKLEDIGADMGYCTVQVWRIKKRALENLKAILEKKKR